MRDEVKSAPEQARLGDQYYSGKGVHRDHAEAARLYRLAAEQGSAHAQFRLGFMYGKGEGVPQDNTEAAKWYRLAAEQGNAGAQCNLGVMYHNGDGVPRDYAGAAKWYRLAAEQGSANAQRNLGFMYRKGEGVPHDDIEAARWYRLAEEQRQASARAQRRWEKKFIGFVFAGLWFGLTTMIYFWEPDYEAKYYKRIPFLVFYGRSTLVLCALVGAVVTFIYLARLYKKRQQAMEKKLENERQAASQVTPLQKTTRILQSTFFIGVMPILASFVTYELVAYLGRYDTSGPVAKLLGTTLIVGIAYFAAFVLGMGLTGRRVDLSDQGLAAQFFGRIGVFVVNAVILGVIIFVTRSCSK
jgi:hypothetical protein